MGDFRTSLQETPTWRENIRKVLRVLQNSNVYRLGDADTIIVSTVLDHACTENNVELIAADTDLLIMLIYFSKSLMGQIIMKTEATKKKHKAIECDIGVTVECIGDVRKYLTFIHAFGGCDNTSAVYGQRKPSKLKLLEKLKAAREEAAVLLQKNVSPEAVCEGERKIFVMFYGGKSSDSLTYLRYINYVKMASFAANVKPESLPPTEQAAMFHIYRVYFQLYEWNTLMESTLDPKDWGWRLKGASLVPFMTDQEPVSDELLKVINKMQLSRNIKKPMQWKTMFLHF